MKFLKVIAAALFVTLTYGNQLTAQAPLKNYDIIRKIDLATDQIVIEKDFLYDKYTLEDSDMYKNEERSFQWDKIKVELAYIEKITKKNEKWAVLKNKRDVNGSAPMTKEYLRDEFKSVTDIYGVTKRQSIPLYTLEDIEDPERYARDGALVKILEEGDKMHIITTTDFKGVWYAPKKYIFPLKDSVQFNKVIVVDRTNQNIATLERSQGKWLVRSMNPATTGLRRPPYKRDTPVGMFVLQEKKIKMPYYKDGTTTIGGSAPYANRFCCGAYIHGVPVDLPKRTQVEFSPTLGTTPRSHMCVRNATSHAEYVYNWGGAGETIVIVIE